MADSMCGPSNALQNFQKQSQGDRTLQQDRLSSRTPQSQGFRTAGPSAHNLDPEFEAFQAGQLPLQHPEAGFHPNFQPQQRMNAGPGASWATDFQRLAIASPGMQQQGLPQAQHAGGWHQEFAQMNNSQAGMSQQGQQHSYNAPLERLSSLATTPFGMGQQPMYQSPMYQPAQQMHNEQPQQLGADVGTFDEAAFAAAFDQAAQSELQSEQASLSHALQDGSHLADAPIGADAIHHPDAPSQQLLTPAQESDDLARTAGALLTSVQGDQSDKFANSVFLQLMRQLRDKEVVVEGDAILPAGSAGSNPHGDGPENSQGGWAPWLEPAPSMAYRRANGRQWDGTPYPMPTQEQIEANHAMLREEMRVREARDRSEGGGMVYRRAAGDDYIRGEMPGDVRGMMGASGRSLEEREQAFRNHLGQMTPEEWGGTFPSRMVRARQLAEELGLAGVVERMKGLNGEIEAEEGRLRAFVEKVGGLEVEARRLGDKIGGEGSGERELRGGLRTVEELRVVAEGKLLEELAREGKSWGPS